MNMKELRHSAGYSQRALAEKAGMNINQIAKIERGEIKLENMTLKNAVNLARALGVSVESLLEKEG